MRILALWGVLLGVAHAAPISLQHQARLIDAAGGPLNGEHVIVLSLWTDPSATDDTAELWSATYPTTVQDGYVGFVLDQSDGGDTVDSEWFGSDVWLQVSVDGSPLLPRTPVLDVPGATPGVASVTVSRPTTPAPGQLWFNRDTMGLEIYVDDDWVAVSSSDPTPRSCVDVQSGGGVTNGLYTIDPDGDGPVAPQQVYCDQTTAGGGWTRVFVAVQNNYNTTSIPYISGLTGSFISSSSRMMMAYTNPANGALTNAWYFPTPLNVSSTTPMSVAQCSYYTSQFTRVADNSTSTRTLRMGWGSFGAFCDQGCSGTWGQICLKQGSSQGTSDGFSDFPLFATFASSTSDHCSQSNQDYRTTGCSDSRRFTILVR